MRTDNEMMWKTLESDVIIDRPWLQARRDRVQLPNGKVHEEYYVLHYPTWINVIAITCDGMMVLERQYRHAAKKVGTEIVAGCVEPGEMPIEAARRELQEETGYTGGTWTELMKIAPNPSTMDNYCHCFLAEGVELTSERCLDETEDIEVILKTKQETFAMLCKGELEQALMVAPLWKYFAENPCR